MSAREEGLRVKVEDVFEAARSVCDSLVVPPLGVAFGPSMVEEAGDSVTPQVKLALDSIPEGMCYMPLLLRETSVSVQAFYPHCSFECID